MSLSSLVPTDTRPEARAKFPVLISYAFARHDIEFFRRFVDHPEIEVLLDSGAFTALNAGDAIDLDDYMRFLDEWGPKLAGYLALDVLGDPSGTDRNLRIMLEQGLDPIPVHVRGDTGERMDELFDRSRWVALGGLRRPHVGWCGKSYIKQKMLWAAGRRVHWLGYTRREMVLGFRPYSIDCSNWAAGSRWGDMHFYYGDLRWGPARMKCSLDTPLNAVEVKLFDELGFTPADVRNMALRKLDRANMDRHVPFMITAWSWVKYIRDLRTQVGTRAFAAVSPFGIEGQLINMIERTA